MNLVKWIKNLKGLKKFRSFVSRLFHFSTSSQQLVTGHVDKHAKKIKNRKAIIKKTKKQVQMDKVLEDKFKIKESDFNRISQIITSEPNIEQAVKDTLQYNSKLHTGLNLGDLGFIKRHDLIATLDGSYHVNVISNHDKVAEKAKTDLHKVIKRKDTLFALPKDGMHLITHSTINKAMGIVKSTYFAQLQSKITILEKRRINNVKNGGDVSIEKKIDTKDKKSSAKPSDAQSFAASLTASASNSSDAKSSAKSTSASSSASKSKSASASAKSTTPEAKKKQSIDEQIAKAHKMLKALDKKKKQLEAKPSSKASSSNSSSSSSASKSSESKASASSSKGSTASKSTKSTASAKSSKATKKSTKASSAKSSKASKASAKSKKASASSASKPAKPYNMPNLTKKTHSKAKKTSKAKAKSKNKPKAKQKNKAKNTIKKPYQMKSAKKSSGQSKKAPAKAKKSKAKSKKRVVILPN